MRLARSLRVVAVVLLGVAASLVLGVGATVWGVVDDPRARHAVSRWIGVNFGEVEPGLYRGGRPTGWRLHALDELHDFKTVVNLAWVGHEVDRAEAEYFRARGVAYHTFSWRPDEAASAEEQAAALALVQQASRPVYVHCVGGKDRTGGLIGLWRRARGMSLDDVRLEWNTYGWPSLAWRTVVAAAPDATGP
jgi:protein tyrosine phosphatase (PTP) superfamily phosphohydrolase (DUF442 family)